MSEDEEKLVAAFAAMYDALYVSSKVLLEIRRSQSKFKDDARAAYSFCAHAINKANEVGKVT